MKSERDVKAACKKLFNKLGVWYFMPSMSGFGMHGIPDFIGAANGLAFGVETKFGDNKPTKLQEFQMNKMRNNNIKVWVVNDKNFSEFEQQFTEWVNASSRN